MNQQPEDSVKGIFPKLFKQDIYIINENDSSTDLKFLGENKKKILILTANEQYEFLSDNEEKLLIKGDTKKGILEALNLKVEDIALVNCRKATSHNFKILHQQFQMTKLISFGVVPKEIGLHIEASNFSLISLNKCQMIFSESLGIIGDNNDKKKLLWTALQKMFGLI